MKTLLILCGGPSAEHDVSIHSAKSIINALKGHNEWSTKVVCIQPNGTWLDENFNTCHLHGYRDNVYLQVTDSKTHTQKTHIDCVFPIIHGTFGEDGALQGFLESFDIPYIGGGVLSSALCMDKNIWKEVASQRGWPVVPWLTYEEGESITYSEVSALLNSETLFIKPSCTGSSIGVSRAHDEKTFNAALTRAFEYDYRIVIEKALTKPRELECAVLGYPNIQASCIGEVHPHHEFYSFDAKYVDANGAALSVPAHIDDALSESLKQLAIDVFKGFECQGMARVDFLVEGDEVYVNEVNTLPGFTSISLYPRLWQHMGLSYIELIERLIQDAEHRHKKKKRPNYIKITDGKRAQAQ